MTGDAIGLSSVIEGGIPPFIRVMALRAFTTVMTRWSVIAVAGFAIGLPVMIEACVSPVIRIVTA
jgi:hypothetical protein